jgi:hypothetical protein
MDLPVSPYARVLVLGSLWNLIRRNAHQLKESIFE